jgi:hypothetical protein
MVREMQSCFTRCVQDSRAASAAGELNDGRAFFWVELLVVGFLESVAISR